MRADSSVFISTINAAPTMPNAWMVDMLAQKSLILIHDQTLESHLPTG